MKKTGNILTFLLAATLMQAQDVSFLNTNQNLVNVNPSFAGSNGLVRNQFSFWSQWQRQQPFVSYVNSFDKYMPGINAGIAVTGQFESYASLVRTGGIGVAYAQQIVFSGGRHKIVPSAQMFYRYTSFDYNLMSSGPPFYMGAERGITMPRIVERGYADLNAGLLYSHDERLFIGASVFHINSPQPGFASGYKIPERYTLYGSYNFSIGRNSILQVMYQGTRQDAYRNSQIGTNLIFAKGFMAGGGLTTGELFYLNAGHKGKALAFSLGYEMSLSKFIGRSYKAWQIHASYSLRDKEHRDEKTSFENM